MATMTSDSSKMEPMDAKSVLVEERTEMATFRSGLAVERTTLAWIRTTLGMTSFGLGMIGFFRSLREHAETAENIRRHEAAIQFGVALVILGLVATVLVVFSHTSMLRKLRAGVTPPPPVWPLSIIISLLLALLALFGMWSLFFS
jgi:putative membrane protein